MLLTLFLNANNYSGLVVLLEGLLGAIGLIGLVIRLWSQHIEKQFDREPQRVQSWMPAKLGRGTPIFLWIMLIAMLLSFVALAAWLN